MNANLSFFNEQDLMDHAARNLWEVENYAGANGITFRKSGGEKITYARFSGIWRKA